MALVAKKETITMGLFGSRKTEEATEQAISHIFANGLPLNPDSLNEVVGQLSGDVSSSEVQEYMSNKYGWNEAFCFDVKDSGSR